MGKVSHSFDRFYIVTKFELPKVEDLKFDDIPYNAECAHLDNPNVNCIKFVYCINCYSLVLFLYLSVSDYKWILSLSTQVLKYSGT